MGIGDWFKRFKRNAASMEEYREGMAPQQGGESQASRAAHEGAAPPRDGASDEHRDEASS